jgi:hypothetical protein
MYVRVAGIISNVLVIVKLQREKHVLFIHTGVLGWVNSDWGLLQDKIAFMPCVL